MGHVDPTSSNQCRQRTVGRRHLHGVKHAPHMSNLEMPCFTPWAASPTVTRRIVYK